MRLYDITERTLVKNGQSIPVKDISLIEKYGVSIYDLRKMPAGIEDFKYSWKCMISTKDPTLVNMIQYAV